MVAQELFGSVEMLSRSVTPSHLKFVLDANGQIIPYEEWKEIRSDDSYAAILLLNELYDNGKAEIEDGSLIVPHEEVCALLPFTTSPGRMIGSCSS